MLDFEKKLFEDLMERIDFTDKNLSKVLNGNNEKKELNITENKNKLVVFKENSEEFVDLNGDMVGPFKIGDKVELPKEIVKILVDGGKVEIVE